MQNEKTQNRLLAILSDGILIIYFLFALFPLVWMVLVSLKSGPELFTTKFIFTPTIDNYIAILFGDARAAAGVVARQEFPRNFMNSLIASSGEIGRTRMLCAPFTSCHCHSSFPSRQTRPNPRFSASVT